MSSSLPVPSKAALTALRGLVVGTSCTLALVAEDRRRKINNAVRAIENGDRIKSAKKYRPGGAALAVAIEEEALWEQGFGSMPPVGLELHRHDLPGRGLRLREGSGNQRGQLGGLDGMQSMGEAPRVEWTTSEDVVASKSDTSKASTTDSPAELQQSTQPAEPSRRPSIQPLPKLATPRKSGPSWAWNNAEVVKSYAFPTSDEIIVRVHTACDIMKPGEIATVLRTVLEAMDLQFAPDNLNRSWIEATALLCRTLREQGRVDDAVALLQRVISRGAMGESAYLGHEPLALIESLMERAELHKQNQGSYAASIDSAVKLFLPKLLDRPKEASSQLYTVGRRLLELDFSKRQSQMASSIYRRCKLVAGDNSNELTSWFLTKLYEKRDYTSVIRVFLLDFAQSSPTEASLHAIGDLVVDSVELAHNTRSEEVLKKLHSICTSLGTTKLSPKWVIKLLTSHWKRTGNLEEIEGLFEGLHTPKLKDSVFRSVNIYRIMVELALEAGEEVKADSYFKRAVRKNRALASDVRLLGHFARFHAADGDWEAVRANFQAMNQRGRPSADAYGQIFIPVLKAYSETHTVRETETFLKSYADDFGVPLCNYTVTLMAKQYGAIRDADSLIDWLAYCSRAGFPVDAAFTNSILVRCRRQWNFPFRDLRTLFRKLRALSPTFVDEHTEKIMTDAALSDSKYGGKAAKGRVLSLRVETNKPASKGQHAKADDVALAMKEALRCHLPRRALWIYKRAVHLRMPFCPHTLRLAVQAQLSWAPDDYVGAYDLLRAAQSRGEVVDPIINYLLAQQLGTITTRTPSETDATIQQTLTQYQQAGIRLTEASLHRAALVCLKAGHFSGAIHYALRAAASSSSSGAGPCFNLQNFKILLAAHAELVNVDGLRDIIARGLSSTYREDAACRRALRHARARVAHSQARPVAEQERVRARAVVDEGIARVVSARKKLREEGRWLEGEAVKIMRQAALDAGGEVVDFGGIPWLGGRKAAGDDADEKPGEGGTAGDEFLDREYYGELERALLEGSGRAAVEAF